MITAPFCSFPDENIDPKLKAKKEWLLKATKAAFYSYGQMPIGGLGLNSAPQYEKNRKYALGRQDIAPYKKLLQGNPDGNNPDLVTDWSIRNNLTTARRNCIQLVLKEPYKVQINPIDDLARGEMEEEYNRKQAKLVVRDAMKERGMIDELELPEVRIESDDAEDFEELAQQQLGMRHRTAMEFESVVDNVLQSNDYDSIKEVLVEDLFDTGVCITRDSSPDMKTIKIDRINPSLFIMSFCMNKDFSDWKYMGYAEPIQCCDLIAKSGGQVTEKDIERLYELGRSSMEGYSLGYAGFTTDMFNWSYDTFYAKGQLFIFDVEIRSADKIVLETRVRKNGQKVYSRGNPEKEGKDKKINYERRYKDNVYCAKWVIGTDILYDFGVKKNQKRDRQDDSVALPSFHVQAVDLNNMIPRSRVEALIPIADEMQVARYKMQDTLNTAIKSGWAINLDAIESVNLGAGGEKLSEYEILNLWVKKGWLLYRGNNIDGSKGGRIAEFMQGGIGSEFIEYANIIASGKQEIKEQLGLNDFTDASTPNPKSLTTIAQAAMSGTNNALGDLFSAQSKMIRSLTKGIIIRCQDIVHYGNTSYLLGSLGYSTIETLKLIKDIDKYIYSVAFEDLPTADELQNFQQQVQIAQEAGEITIADAVRLGNIRNLKQKEMFLVSAVQKNRTLKQQEAIQLQKTNGEIQQQSAMVAAQASQSTIQMEFDLKMKLIQMEKDLELRNAERVEQIRLEGKRIDAMGRVESADVQAEGRDISNKRDNIVKLELAETPKDKTIVENIVSDNQKSTITPQTAYGQPLELQEYNLLPEDVA